MSIGYKVEGDLTILACTIYSEYFKAFKMVSRIFRQNLGQNTTTVTLYLVIVGINRQKFRINIKKDI